MPTDMLRDMKTDSGAQHKMPTKPIEIEDKYEVPNDDYTEEVAGLSVHDIAFIEGIDLSDWLRDQE